MAFQSIFMSFLEQNSEQVGGQESRREASMMGLDRKCLDSFFILNVCLDMGRNPVQLNKPSSALQGSWSRGGEGSTQKIQEDVIFSMHLKKATGLMDELTFQSRGNALIQLHRQEETWDLSGWDEPNHYLPCGWVSIRSSIPFATIMPSLISFMYGFWDQPYAFTQSRYQWPKPHWHLQPTIKTVMVQCTRVLTH